MKLTMINFERNKQALYSTAILSFIIFSLLALASLSHANSTTSASVSNGSNLAGGTLQIPMGPITTDEGSGDDGELMKKDLESIKSQPASNKSEDSHTFYQPEYISDRAKAMSYWFDFSKLPSTSNISTKHEMLSKSHRRAAPIKLSFEFPFYGQPLKNIIIATGGFLYVGEHLHHWLAATQNISPLMANFDLSASNYSDIHHYDNGSALFVQWQNVQMKDNKPPGNFSFQVTLFKNGDIVFVYDSLPVPIYDIPEDEHPVKVGLSDAFLIERMAFFIRRKTIYDYHRLNMKDVPDIKNGTAVYLKALPTCNQFDTCEKCSKAEKKLECSWCDAVKRCSNGFDRKRQEWLTQNCDKASASERNCSAKTVAQQSSASPTATSVSPAIPAASGPAGLHNIPSIDHLERGSQTLNPDKPGLGPDSRVSEGGTAFMSILMLFALTSGIAFWAFYAYKNPHTPSGQLLIRYRPTNWRWQDAETRYTAASIHM